MITRIAMTSALTAVALTGTSGLSYAGEGAWTNWSTQNNFDVTSDGTTTTIDASGNLAGGTSSNLDILGHQTVNVNQSSSDALFYARAEGNQDPTRILGTLNSNGRLLVIDRNGVFFGPGSSVDAAGIVATTGDISDEQIRNNEFGNYTFENVISGRIDLQGQITVAEAGLAAFVAPTVTNSGVINAKVGKVAFASGEKVTLDLYGDNLVEIEVAGDNADALLENTGTISAEGGQVHMTAAAAKNAVDNIVNVEGVVTVASATKVGGKIVLSGGNSGVVKVAANLDASGKNGGGKIDVKGQDVQVAENAVLDASAIENGNGGRVDVIAENHLDFRGLVLSRGGREGGNGGDAEVSGYGILGYSGRADLSAKYGKMGTLLLDPEFAVIHSGLLHQPLGLGYVLSAQALANSMQTASIVVQADNFIDVGTRTGGYNTGNVIVDAFLNSLADGNIDLSTYDYDRWEQVGTWGFGWPWYDWVNYTGTTAGNISFNTATLNINKDLKLGSGNLDINASTVNLNGTLSDVNGLLNQGDITTVASTVNVLSNNALIQQGIYAAATGADVNVSAGTYNEALYIEKAINLRGANAGIDAATGVRGAESVITNTGEWYNIYTDVANVTIDGFKIEGDNNVSTDDYMIAGYNANNLNILNNDISAANFGTFLWGGTVTRSVIANNNLHNIAGTNGQAIHVRDNQYADIINNTVSDANVGITTENFYSASLDGERGLIDGNTISAKSIGIRNNLSYGSQSGFQISNNTITAEDAASDRRWTGIDIISQMGGVGTLFLNNDIDGSAVSAIRLAVGYEGTNLTAGNTIIHGGDVSGVKYGVWATDGSFYTGAVNDLTIQNVAFANIGEAAILAEDVYDAEDVTKSVNSTGTKITIGSGNTYTNTPYELAIAGANVIVNDNAVNTTLVKAAGNSTYIGAPTGYVGGQWEVQNGSIQKGINATAAGGTVDVEAGTFTEDLTISKNGLTLNGAQAGVDARDRSAVETVLEGFIATASNLDGLTVDGFTIEHQGGTANRRASLYLGNNVSNVSAINNIFEGQDPTGANGSGGIITSSTGVKDIVAENNLFKNYRYGIYVNKNADNFAIDNNNFDANSYGIIIQDGGSATHIDGNNFLNNTLAGIYVYSANGPISSIGTFTNNFFRDNMQHISYRDGNAPDLLVDASTGNQFYSDGSFKTTDTMTLDELFALEDLVTHKLDNGAYGLVVLREGNVYVTGTSGSIQRGIDASDVGGTVNVDSSTYQENILIDKSVKLTGHGTTLQYDTANDGPGRGTAGNLITVTAANVNIDPFTFDGLGSADYGINANGANNLIVDGNSFTGFVETNINLINSAEARIFGNTMTGAKKGVSADNAYNVQINNNTITGATVAGIHVKNSNGNGYDGSGKDVDIWSNIITNGAKATGVLIENSAYATVGYHPTNPFITTANGGNTITGGANGIVVRGSDNAYISHNTVSGQTASDGPASGDAIYVADSRSVKVFNNVITNVSDEGVQGDNADNISVNANRITNARGAGISLMRGSDNQSITNNVITTTGQSGIFSSGKGTLTITGNTITDTGNNHGGNNFRNDGIHVDNAFAGEGNRVSGTAFADGGLIDNNTITDFADAGIELVNINSGLTVSNNTISNGGTGVFSNHSDYTVIDTNEISDMSVHGVNALNSNAVQVLNNTISDIGQNGIIVGGTSGSENYSDEGATITGNDIQNASYDGIHVHYANGNIVISENTIDHSGDDGIEAHHIYGTLDISGNTITQSGYGISGGGEGSEYGGFDEFGNGHDGIQVSHVTASGYGPDYGDDDNVSASFARISNVYNPYAVTISGNTIDISGDDGVEVTDVSGRVLISYNEITNSGYGDNTSYGDQSYHGSDAIHVRNVFANSYYGEGPVQAGSTSTGYYGYDVDIIGNTIDTAADDGIEVINAGSVLIDTNIITNVGFNPDYNGYAYSGSNYNYGSDNTNGGDGIHVRDVYGNGDYIPTGYYEGEEVGHIDPYAVVIVNNTIGTASEEPANNNDDDIQAFRLSEIRTSMIGDDGIEVVNAGRVLIKDNEIANVGNSPDYSTYYDYSYGEGYDYSYMYNETNGGDGIHVRNAGYGGYIGVPSISVYEQSVVSENGTNGYGVQIIGNTITLTADDGIEVVNAGRTLIDGNTISDAGHSNSSVYSLSEVSYGSGDSWGADGIHVRNVGGNRYDLRSTEFGLLDISDEDMITITNNNVDVTADDGIQVLYSGNTLIDGNTVTNAGYGRGYDYEGEGSRDGNGADGIHVDTGFEPIKDYPGEVFAFAKVLDYPGYMNNTRVQISNNSIDTTGNDGIETQNVSNLIITDNTVSNVQVHGVLVGGEQNGSVLFSGNTLTNNPVGARFESGVIDISDLENPNRIINTNPSALPVGLQFDGNPEILSIAGLTIGATQFDGFQNPGSYYVRFEDGSILDSVTGLPLLINGLNASYDGFTPPVSGILTQTQLDSIEARLYDADDITVNGRGQIFAGFVPAQFGLTLDNIEDFFNRFGLTGGGANTVQLIITGLPSLGQFNQQPSVPAPGPNANPFDPSFLAGLEPAAGDESGNEQGTQNLNAIEPNGGEEEATCWGDALNYASSGITTTYSFGGTMEDGIAQEAGCGSASGA